MTAPTPWPPADAVPVETHISTVWLTPAFAYKAKKPVRLVFVDGSTLAAREHFCREELRLNARTAPGLYLDVLPVTQEPDGTVLDGRGPVVDWAVQMRRFPAGALLAELADAGQLTAWHVDRAAAAIARFHAALPALPASAQCAKTLRAWAAENIAEILELVDRQPSVTSAEISALGAALDARYAAEAPWQAQRVADGWLREGHGDLHLGNLVVWGDDVLAFDAIDFDPSLRIIDPVADAAFCFMDLLAREQDALAWRFVSAWAEGLGDVGGLRGLWTATAYRALVRAKVALLMHDAAGFARYWRVAARAVSVRPAPLLVLTTGLSGSGKSTAAAMLAEQLGALRLRSDVERKRLHGLAPTDRPAPAQALYSAAATQRTYARLEELAAALLAAGQRVVVDAAALRQAERERFGVLAAAQGAAFALVECVAGAAVMAARLDARAAAGTDPSDADVSVLRRQQAAVEPVPASWAARHHVLRNDADPEALRHAVAALVTPLTEPAT
jgi:uncharacterized protein